MFRPSLLVVAVALSACQPDAPVEPAARSAAPPRERGEDDTPPPAAKGSQRYGAPLAGATAAELARVVEKPTDYADKTVTLEGTVRRACSRKGCWMELATTADDAAPGCRVTFKDYGFFVPTDSAGARAKVEGVVKVQTVSKETVLHHEGEGATYRSKNPDGSATEVRLVANGVELTKS